MDICYSIAFLFLKLLDFTLFYSGFHLFLYKSPISLHYGSLFDLDPQFLHPMTEFCMFHSPLCRAYHYKTGQVEKIDKTRQVTAAKADLKTTDQIASTLMLRIL